MSNGWIILDKPMCVTSRKAGAVLSRIFNASSFGHIGTLDPMASGLLPIALGQATKMIPFWNQSHKKEYLFGIQFGFETDTLDITGRVTNKTNIVPLPDQVRAACIALTGEISQIPPAYSAVHVGGRRAHELARAGKSVVMPPRYVTIDVLELVEVGNKSWIFRVVCSTGTYVRSIARDIAQMCGTLATVDMIRRVRANGLQIKDAVKLDFLENLFNNGGNTGEYLRSVDYGLGDIPVLNLNDEDADLYKKGRFIKMAKQRDFGLVRVFSNKQFLGIGSIESDLLKPKRTLN
jgi:tRNA pseudouridine55 synthase